MLYLHVTKETKMIKFENLKKLLKTLSKSHIKRKRKQVSKLIEAERLSAMEVLILLKYCGLLIELFDDIKPTIVHFAKEEFEKKKSGKRLLVYNVEIGEHNSTSRDFSTDDYWKELKGQKEACKKYYVDPISKKIKSQERLLMANYRKMEKVMPEEDGSHLPKLVNEITAEEYDFTPPVVTTSTSLKVIVLM